MKPQPKAAPALPDGWPLRLFAALFGALLGLTLLKFGNPAIMESSVSAPKDAWEFFLWQSWPIAWAYSLLGLAAVPGLIAARWKINAPPWLIALPLVWLIWQFLAASHSLDPSVSPGIVAHFAACVVCFYLGLFSLSKARSLASFWSGITLAFVLVLAVGWQQHFGGLAETRRYFWANIYPDLKSPLPAEYYKRLNSDRIFSTLFYPNTLAGVLLLLLPPALAAVAAARRLTIPARAFLVAVIALAALACLFWSGSKAGWLLMLLLGIVALLRLPFDKKFRIALVAGVLFLGLIGFLSHFAAFLKRAPPAPPPASTTGRRPRESPGHTLSWAAARAPSVPPTWQSNVPNPNPPRWSTTTTSSRPLIPVCPASSPTLPLSSARCCGVLPPAAQVSASSRRPLLPGDWRTFGSCFGRQPGKAGPPEAHPRPWFRTDGGLPSGWVSWGGVCRGCSSSASISPPWPGPLSPSSDGF